MKKSQHILMATELDLKTHGGDITHVKEVVSQLSRLDCRITLTCPKTKHDKKMPGRLVEIPGFPFRFFYLMSHEALLLGYCLISHLWQKYSAVYVRSELYSLGAAVFAKLTRRPLIVEFNGCKTHEMRQRAISSKAIAVVKVVEALLCRWADKIVITAPQLKEILERQYNVSPTDIEYISNGVDTTHFRPMSTSLADKQPSQVTVGFIGCLIEWQGLQNLIDAALSLAHRPDIQFTIVGDGPLYPSIQEQVKQKPLTHKIKMTGRVSHQDIPQWINGFDICLIPRNLGIIGMPVKLFEYMACARPVIASRLPGFDFLEQTQSGLLVEPGNAQALAQAIETLADAPQLRRTYGKNGRKTAVTHFSWAVTAQAILLLIQEVKARH